MVDDSRRRALGFLALAGISGAAGAATPLRRKLALTSPDEVAKLQHEVEQYLKPGVFVGIKSQTDINGFGKQTRLSSYVNIEVDLDTDFLKRTAVEVQLVQDQMVEIAQRIPQLEPIDRMNVAALVTAVKGPYTLVALVGSAASASDKAPSDIDILILNGGKEPYLSRGALFDNQHDRVHTIFRPAHGSEVVDIVRQYNPAKAKIMKEDLDLKAQGKPGHWYGPQLHAEFLLPATVPYPAGPDFFILNRTKDVDDLPSAFSKPIHLLTPAVGQLEAVVYNAHGLQKALHEGKAMVLYQGRENKLI